MSNEHVVEIFRGVTFFRGLDADELYSVLDRFLPVTVEAGQTVCKEGDDAEDGLYLVEEGLLSVSVRGSDGKPLEITKMGRGEIFGEMGVLDGSKRSATVRADQTSALMRMSRQDFRRMIRDGDKAAVKVLHNLSTVVAGRVRERYQNIESLLKEPARPSAAAGEGSLSGRVKRWFGGGK